MLWSENIRMEEQLQSELDGYKMEQSQYENDRKSAARFLKLVERYSNAEEMTTLMLNEFVEKIIVHERDRKGSADTTQKMRKKEARKDRLHQNYLKRKANGKQKEYEERTKAKNKAKGD